MVLKSTKRVAYLLSVWVAHLGHTGFQRAVYDASSAATAVPTAPSTVPERMTDDPNLYVWHCLEHIHKAHLPRG